MMPSIKDLIINKCSAQNGMHNGMTPKDAGHVILNLFNLWEPCTELTFESLESQAKQDHSAPYRVRNRRACTCKHPFFTLLFDEAAWFSVSSPQHWPWGGHSLWEVSRGTAQFILPCTADSFRAAFSLHAPKTERISSIYTTWYQGLYLINHLNPTRLLQKHFSMLNTGNRRVWFSMDPFILKEPQSALARIDSYPEKVSRAISRNAAVVKDLLLTWTASMLKS